MSTVLTRRISGNASGGQTVRVTARPAGGHSERIPANFLLLEGDMQSSGSDGLLLEGDVQTGDDLLKLEGDHAVIIGGTTTRRILEPVS